MLTSFWTKVDSESAAVGIHADGIASKAESAVTVNNAIMVSQASQLLAYADACAQRIISSLSALSLSVYVSLASSRPWKGGGSSVSSPGP